jgi:mono/diheme cytochrome c family protein
MLHKENYDRLLILGLVFTLLIFLGFAAYLFMENNRVASAAEILAEERVTLGRAIYNEQCVSCHGANGEGGVGTALNNKLLLKNTLDQVFFSVIRSGVPSTQMPSWSVDYGGPLTDEDIHNVVAFIRAWEPTAPEILPVVFEPSPAQGALIFETTCATCHGSNGAGVGETPAVNDPAALAALDDDWLRQLLTYGLPAQGMPAYGVALTTDQIEHLVALFGAWRTGEQVAAAYNVTDLAGAAIFALQAGDAESAALQVARALAIVPAGPAADVLLEADAALAAGDAAGALTPLETLRDQWPLGDAESGAVFYAEKCAVCHGAAGEGGIGTALQPNQYVQDNNNAALVEFILTGRPGTAMAGWEGRATEQELADVVAFLRTWQP